MDPEQGLLVIHEDLSVKSNVLIFRTLARVLCPKRMDIIDRNRTFQDLDLFLRFLFLAFSLFVVCIIFRSFLDMLYYRICIQKIFLIDGLIFRLCIRLGEVDLHRHEGAVFFQDFPCPVLIRKLKAVLVQEQCDL